MTHELIRKKKNGLQTEFAITAVEEILQRRAKKVEDHGVVIALGAKPSDMGNT